MKACGSILCVVAVLAAILMCATTVVNYSLQTERLEDSRDDLAESIEEHKEEIQSRYQDSYYTGGGYSHDEDECSTCEYHEDQEKSLDRSETSNLLSLLQALALYILVYSGLLFGVGAIVSKMGDAKAVAVEAPAVAPVPVAEPVVVPAPVSNVCPYCGTAKQPGSRFCGTCGNSFDH